MLVKLRLADAGINIHVVSGVLNGLIRANPERFGKYMEFEVTRSWAQSLYQRIKFSCRAVTTSRPVITRSLWVDIRSQFLYKITDKVLKHIIPDELIINVDQTPCAGASCAGATDKRAITVTLSESLDGHILPLQLIYTGKMQRSLPNVTFPDGFCLAYNQKHWSNKPKQFA